MCLRAIRHRLDFAHEVQTRYSYLYEDPKVESAGADVRLLYNCLEKIPEASFSYRNVYSEASKHIPNINHLLRRVLTGTEIGVALEELFPLLGRSVIIRRFAGALSNNATGVPVR